MRQYKNDTCRWFCLLYGEDFGRAISQYDGVMVPNCTSHVDYRNKPAYTWLERNILAPGKQLRVLVFVVKRHAR